MKNLYYLFRVLDSNSIIDARQELEETGLAHIFIIEDDALGETLIGGFSSKEIHAKKSILVEKRPAEVNWEEQWSQFAENFADGHANIAVGNKTLLLSPGAGFGDLSHPTTYLMLEMMKDHVANESIIDIGTGSGILALAALHLDAKSAIGIDIDKAAIDHAKKNAKLNNLPAKFSKELPKNLSSENIILMNMIFPEQQTFAPQALNHLSKLWIVSGILHSEKEKYLLKAKEWNWQLIREHKKSDWLGFVLKPL